MAADASLKVGMIDEIEGVSSQLIELNSKLQTSQTPTPPQTNEENMTLTEFIAQNAEAKKEHDNLIATAKTEAQTELNRQYAICFSTPTGEKVFEHLKRCTIDQPTWQPSNGNLDGASVEQYAFVREGQNSITRNIQDRINSIKKK